eukprot:RCo041277
MCIPPPPPPDVSVDPTPRISVGRICLCSANLWATATVSVSRAPFSVSCLHLLRASFRPLLLFRSLFLSAHSPLLPIFSQHPCTCLVCGLFLFCSSLFLLSPLLCVLQGVTLLYLPALELS